MRFPEDYKVALVTGCSSGIGLEVAKQLSGLGVAIAGIDLKPGAALPGRSAFRVGDVTQPGELAQRVRELETELGPIDLLVASAGIGRETTASDYKAEEVNAVIGVNLLGVSNAIAAVLPGMIARKRGHLVGLSSLASLRGLPRMFGYSASKAGLNSLMEGIRVETKPLGIHVTTVCPGWVRTPMTAQIDGKVPSMLEADACARRILDAIRKKRTRDFFPASMIWQFRIFNCMPTFLRDKILLKMLTSLKPKHGMDVKK